MKEEVYLTTFELIHTYGFWKIISVVWSIPITILTILFYIIKNKDI